MEPTIHLLIGYPGVGKLTIAKEMVAQLTASGHEARLVDNHFVNDPIFHLVRTDGRTPLPDVVWEKVARLRDVIHSTIAEVSPTEWSFVMTIVLFEEPDDLAFVDEVSRLADARGNRFRVTVLECEREQHLSRVTSPGRREAMKIHHTDVLEEILDRPLAWPDEHDPLRIDITELSPGEAATRILAH